jgi:GNAT superfamily N-acetyltransferase
MIQLRLAHAHEMDWINERYDEIHFMHSRFDREIIAIAEYEGQKAGLGRLVTLDDGHLELGGMYVLEAFRRHGIARKIVPFLLDLADPNKIVYCIPFQHLLSFYEKFGFVPCHDLSNTPQDLKTKIQWCSETYALQGVSLLYLPKRADVRCGDGKSACHVQ